MLFDIFFISYQEPNADTNWELLRQRFPYARRLHGVTGLHKAHQLAAKIVATDYFWVVDGDSTIVNEFAFTPPYSIMDQYEHDKIQNVVYVYRARNPVNNLSYGYGGVKLLPKQATVSMSIGNIDMTTSISEHFCPVDQVASITNFNTDPFNSWKSAFRECVKLSSKAIGKQVDTDTENRLEVWCTQGTDVDVLRGAQAGREYGSANRDNTDALKLINDFEWLKERFDEQ